MLDFIYIGLGLGGIVAVGLFAYLRAALLRPDRF
jgi:K+-transporting ATPase KdpF subunit